jgi:hypothetical protein
MKAVPCVIIVNNWMGYCFTPQRFPSISQAYQYGKRFLGGTYFRIFDLEGKLVKTGRCNS